MIAISFKAQAATKRIRVTPDQIHLMSQKLAEMIAPQFSPDLLIGIARGGLSLLHYLAAEDGLDQRRLAVINLHSYEKTKKTNLKFAVQASLSGFEDCRKILLVDDLADSGESLLAAKKFIQKTYPDAEVKTATFFYKKRSLIKPDFFYDTVSEWIVFPPEYKVKAPLEDHEIWYQNKDL